MPGPNHQKITARVDECMMNGCSHYDIARIIDACNIKSLHRYNDCGWEVFRNGAWVPDPRGASVGMTVMSRVSAACNERALYWQNLLLSGQSMDPDLDEQRVMSLMELSLKFRDPKFLRDVVSECRSFLEA